MYHGSLDNSAHGSTPTASQPLRSPSQAESAGTTLVVNPPIPRNTLPPNTRFPTKPSNPNNDQEISWTFFSADPSVPGPNASCALLLSTCALKVAEATISWVAYRGAGDDWLPDGNDDDFEIKQIDGKGLGLVAVRDLPKGCHVVRDLPILICHQWDLDLQEGDAVLQHALSHLSPEKQADYLALAVLPGTGSGDLRSRFDANAIACLRWDPYRLGPSYSAVFPVMSRWVSHDRM